MPFDPAEYLKLAEELLSGSSESHYRSSISRAYYSAFLSASIAPGVARLSIGEGSHESIWDQFESDTDKNGDSIGKKGKSLKARRKVADYKLQSRITARDAEFAVEEAKAIIDYLNGLN